jgi:hypothetical protein
MKYVLFVLVVGTVTVALVIDVIVLVWWLRRAAMNAFAAIGKKLFAGRKGRSAMVQKVHQAAERGRKVQSNQQTQQTYAICQIHILARRNPQNMRVFLQQPPGHMQNVIATCTPR